MSDLIDREAVREFIKSYRNSTDVAFHMEDHLDEIPAASPWRRVEAELPKEHMWCFVYTDEPDMIMPIRIAFYTASCMGKGSWYHYESGSDITDEVDYWAEMLLEGPKLNHDLPWPIEPPKEDA